MKTNEQIISEIEAKLATKTTEEKQAFIQAQVENDIATCRRLSRELQADIQIVPNDIHHIKVDGNILGYNEFETWRQTRLHELASAVEEHEEHHVEVDWEEDDDWDSEDEDEDEEISNVRGFFN